MGWRDALVLVALFILISIFGVACWVLVGHILEITSCTR